MDKDDALLKILGKLRGGRLEDVADKLIALFRQPEWWEEEFDGLDHGVGHPSDSCPRWKHLTH